MSEFSESRPPGDIPDAGHEGLYLATSFTPEIAIVRQSDLGHPAGDDAQEPFIVAGSDRRNLSGADTEHEEAVPQTDSPAPTEPPPETNVVIIEPELPHTPNPESSVALEVAPQLTFVEPPYCPPDLKVEHIEAHHEGRDSASFEGASRPTDEERRIITTSTNALLQVGRELGVDLSDRRLKPEHYHFFDRREDMANEVPAEVMAKAFYKSKAGVLALRSSQSDLRAFELTHETAHSLTLHRIGFIFPEGQFGQLTGYVQAAEDAPDFLNTGITELACDIFADRAMGATVAGSPSQGPVLTGNTPLDIVGDAIIRETAAAHTLSPHEVEDMLLKGCLNGDQTGLQLIGEALGAERMARFRELTGQEGGASFIRTAYQLGFPQAAVSIERADNRQPFKIFSWRRSVLSH